MSDHHVLSKNGSHCIEDDGKFVIYRKTSIVFNARNRRRFHWIKIRRFKVSGSIIPRKLFRDFARNLSLSSLI